MTLRARRWVYLSFIITFAAAAPLVILYTQGYRYNLKRQRLDPTGTLVLSTVPRGAAISLNGQTLKFVTPKTLQAIPPATYNIKLSIDGYRPWEKKLQIKAGAALFVSNIRLWKNSIPEKISEGLYQLFSASPDGTSVIFTVWRGNLEQFFRFDVLTDESPRLIFERPMQKPSSDIIWSPQMNRVLVSGPEETGVLELGRKSSWQAISGFVPSNISNFRWDTINEDLLYGSDKQTVYTIDLAKKNSAPLVSASPKPANKETLTDYWLRNNTILELIQVSESKSLLRTFSLVAENEKKEFPLPSSLAYKFLAANDDLIATQDSTQKMSVWRITNESIFPILDAASVTQAVFSIETADLLYATPFEIWTYNPKTDTANLLTRIASEISNANWYPDGSHVLFASNQNLVIMERDERDARNQWELTAFQDLTGYTLSPDGTAVYFTGTIGSTPGFWRLDL